MADERLSILVKVRNEANRTLRVIQKELHDTAAAADDIGDSDGIERAGKKAGRASQKTDKLGSSLKNVGRNANALAGRMRLLSLAVGGVGAAALALRQEMAALGATAAGVFVDVKFESVRERLSSVTKDTDTLNKRMQALIQTASQAGMIAGVVGPGASRLIASGMSRGLNFEQSLSYVKAITQAAGALGVAASDTNTILEDFAGMVGQGEVALSDLMDALAFTNDPAAVLARALGKTREEIIKLANAGYTLGGGLDNIKAELSGLGDDTSNLSEVWSTLLNTVTTVLMRFNQSGVITAVVSQLSNLNDWLKTTAAGNLIDRLAKTSVHFVTVTIPALVKGIYNGWHAILDTIATVVGFLIGSAVGGIYGGIIGALIGRSETARKIMIGFVKDTGEHLGSLTGDLEDSGKAFAGWGATIARVVAFALDTLSSGLKTISTAFSLVGTTLAAGVAQINALLHGNWQGAQAIGDMWWDNVSRITDSLGKFDANKYRSTVDEILAGADKLQQAGDKAGGGKTTAGSAIADAMNRAKATAAERARQQRLARQRQNAGGYTLALPAVGAGAGAAGAAQAAAAGSAGLSQYNQAGAQRYNQMMARGIQLTRQMRTTQEMVNAQVREYKQLLRVGAINQQTFNRAVGQAKGKLKDMGAQMGETTQFMTDFAQTAARGVMDMFTQFLFNPMDFSFKDALRGFVRMLQQMAIRAAANKIFKALFGGGGIGGGGGGGGGIFSQIFGWIGSLFHDGGIVGAGGAAKRAVPASTFLGAPRFHGGGFPGLNANEVPAILEKGEEVLTRNDPRHAANGGGQGYRIVNVVDPALAADYLTTPPGEQLILNIIRKNPSAVKGALA